jgi:hypothetical protein
MWFLTGDADCEVARDLFVGAALLNERQDLALAGRQGRQRLLRVEVPHQPGEASEHRGSDVRRAMHAAYNGVDEGAAEIVGAAFAGPGG